MILQYKGFKNNWCYEEAEQITHANVYVGDVIKEALTKKFDNGLEQAKYVHECVDKHLIEETGCFGDEIIYYVDKFYDLKNVTVVMLDDKNKHVVKVFYNNTVYLLNNRGQTVQRLI